MMSEDRIILSISDLTENFLAVTCFYRCKWYSILVSWIVIEIISDAFLRDESYTKIYSWHEIELTVSRKDSTHFSDVSSSTYIHDDTISGSSPPFSVRAKPRFWKAICRLEVQSVKSWCHVLEFLKRKVENFHSQSTGLLKIFEQTLHVGAQNLQWHPMPQTLFVCWQVQLMAVSHWLISQKSR